MVRLNFVNAKGCELPDHYDCGPADYRDEKHAMDIVIDALSHTINMTKLKDVEYIRVVGSDGNSLDLHKDSWCYWS